MRKLFFASNSYFNSYSSLFKQNCVSLNSKSMNGSMNNPENTDENESQNKVAALVERLDNVDRYLKRAHKEITEIRKELVGVRQLSVPTVRHASTSVGKRKGAPLDSEDGCNTSNKTQRFDFTIEDGYVVVYTDGACENNGRCNAKAGIGVWFGENHALNISEPVTGRATNNVAEIQACKAAISMAHTNGVRKLKIKSDSQFVINSITSWIHKWKKNNWKLASGGDVKNKEDFVALDQACRTLDDIKWEYVAGHKGIQGNEGADRLARDGALRYK